MAFYSSPEARMVHPRSGRFIVLFDESESVGNSCRLGNDRESRSGCVDSQENNSAWSSSERYRSRKVRWRRRQTAWHKRLTSKDGSVSDMTCRMLLNTTASLDVGEGGIVSRVCGSMREEGPCAENERPDIIQPALFRGEDRKKFRGAGLGNTQQLQDGVEHSPGCG
jgi:hypothetical protein